MSSFVSFLVFSDFIIISLQIRTTTTWSNNNHFLYLFNSQDPITTWREDRLHHLFISMQTPALVFTTTMDSRVRTPHEVVLGNHYNNFPQQPRQLPPPPVGRWSTGLCGAYGEYWNCLVTHFCPWYTFGQIAEIVDEGTTSCCNAALLYLAVQFCLGCCFTPMVTTVYRARIRHKFNIPPGRCCGDLCLHFWCQCFALRQVMSTIHYSSISSS